MQALQNERAQKIDETRKHTRPEIDYVLFLREIIAKSIQSTVRDWQKYIVIYENGNSPGSISTQFTAVHYLDEAVTNSIYPRELLYYGEKDEKSVLSKESNSNEIKFSERKTTFGHMVDTACNLIERESGHMGSMASSVIGLTLTRYGVEDCAEAAFQINENTFSTRDIVSQSGEIAETCKSLAAMIRECYRDRKKEFREKSDPLNLFLAYILRTLKRLASIGDKAPELVFLEIKALEETICKVHLGFSGLEESKRATDNDRKSWWLSLKASFSDEHLIDVDHILHLCEVGLKILAERMEEKLNSRACEALLEGIGNDINSTIANAIDYLFHTMSGEPMSAFRVSLESFAIVHQARQRLAIATLKDQPEVKEASSIRLDIQQGFNPLIAQKSHLPDSYVVDEVARLYKLRTECRNIFDKMLQASDHEEEPRSTHYIRELFWQLQDKARAYKNGLQPMLDYCGKDAKAEDLDPAFQKVFVGIPDAILKHPQNKEILLNFLKIYADIADLILAEFSVNLSKEIARLGNALAVLEFKAEDHTAINSKIEALIKQFSDHWGVLDTTITSLQQEFSQKRTIPATDMQVWLRNAYYAQNGDLKEAVKNACSALDNSLANLKKYSHTIQNKNIATKLGILLIGRNYCAQVLEMLGDRSHAIVLENQRRDEEDLAYVRAIKHTFNQEQIRKRQAEYLTAIRLAEGQTLNNQSQLHNTGTTTASASATSSTADLITTQSVQASSSTSTTSNLEEMRTVIVQRGSGSTSNYSDAEVKAIYENHQQRPVQSGQNTSSSSAMPSLASPSAQPLAASQIVDNKAEKEQEQNSNQSVCNKELLRVARLGYLTAIQHWLKQGADVNTTEGETEKFNALFWVIRKSSFAATHFLLSEVKADVTTQDIYGNGILQTALLYQEKYDQRVVDLVLKVAIADTTLQAVLEDDDKKLAKLKTASVDLGVVDSHGYTMLHYAAARGKLKALSWLTLNFPHMISWPHRMTSRTPLLLAARNGQISAMEWLLKKGAQLTETDKNGHTALLVAAAGGQIEVMEWLLKKGAQLTETNQHGKTALLVAAAKGQIGSMEWLLKKGAQLTETDKGGSTALLVAAAYGQIEVMEWLLGKGTQLTETGRDGNTALLVAAASGQIEVMEWLLKKGAQLTETDKDGWTALLMAAANSQISAMEWLLKKGAQLTETDKDGNTALLVAAAYGQIPAMEWLLRNGSQLNEEDKRGHTAIRCAIANNQTKAVVYLENYTAKHKRLLKAVTSNRGQEVTQMLQGDNVNPHMVMDADPYYGEMDPIVRLIRFNSRHWNYRGGYSAFTCALARGFEGIANIIVAHSFRRIIGQRNLLNQGALKIVHLVFQLKAAGSQNDHATIYYTLREMAKVVDENTISSCNAPTIPSDTAIAAASSSSLSTTPPISLADERKAIANSVKQKLEPKYSKILASKDLSHLNSWIMVGLEDPNFAKLIGGGSEVRNALVVKLTTAIKLSLDEHNKIRSGSQECSGIYQLRIQIGITEWVHSHDANIATNFVKANRLATAIASELQKTGSEDWGEKETSMIKFLVYQYLLTKDEFLATIKDDASQKLIQNVVKALNRERLSQLQHFTKTTLPHKNLPQILDRYIKPAQSTATEASVSRGDHVSVPSKQDPPSKNSAPFFNRNNVKVAEISEKAQENQGHVDTADRAQASATSAVRSTLKQ